LRAGPAGVKCRVDPLDPQGMEEASMEGEDVCVVLSTFANEEDAARAGRALVERRLVACVNLVPGVRSIYRWQGRVEDEPEILAVMKTRRDRLPELLAAPGVVGAGEGADPAASEAAAREIEKAAAAEHDPKLARELRRVADETRQRKPPAPEGIPPDIHSLLLARASEIQALTESPTPLALQRRR
jgi:uncharacterized protein involved in tolerance to divalent cations